MPDNEGPDRRTAHRVGFVKVQHVAFGDHEQRPDESELQMVVCMDLSSTGVSFYLPARPATDKLVVRLTQQPIDTWLRARVVRVTEVARSNGKMFLIGCELLDPI